LMLTLKMVAPVLVLVLDIAVASMASSAHA
jgi:hypothetical protein